MRPIATTVATMAFGVYACFTAQAAAPGGEREDPALAHEGDSTAARDAEVNIDAAASERTALHDEERASEPGRSAETTAPTAAFDLLPEDEPSAPAGPTFAPPTQPDQLPPPAAEALVLSPPALLPPLKRPAAVEPPLLAVPPSASAPYGPRSGTPELDRGSDRDAPRSRQGPRGYGVMLDVAVPDGIMASAVIRPLRWLRMHVGGGSNTISGGVRAGASLIPFGVGPSVTLEAGHYFEGDANRFARETLGVREDLGRVLDRFGYDFANGHVGLELGQGRMTFFAHAGVSYLRAKVHETSSLFGPPIQSSAGTTTITVNADPTLVAIMPSAKLGFVAYIL